MYTLAIGVTFLWHGAVRTTVATAHAKALISLIASNVFTLAVEQTVAQAVGHNLGSASSNTQLQQAGSSTE
jgi:hypothetical protein